MFEYFLSMLLNQGCAPAEPGSPWYLTFDLRRLESLRFSHKSFVGHPRFHSFRALGSLQFSLEHSLVKYKKCTKYVQFGRFPPQTGILGCIHYVSCRGGQRILGGVLKFLEQKKGDMKFV